MKAANAKADEIFNTPEHKYGRDMADNILIEDRLFVKFVSSDTPMKPGESDGPMPVHDVLINKWTITFYNDAVYFPIL